MKLDAALVLCASNQYLARQSWIDKGSVMRLIDSARSIENLSVELTAESYNADDWKVFEVR